MKKQIVIINGTGGSGKDTFVEFCTKYGKIMNFSSVDKVKEIAKYIGSIVIVIYNFFLGIINIKFNEIRTFTQII